MQNYIDEIQHPDDIRRGMTNRPRNRRQPWSIQSQLEAETAPNPMTINMFETAREVVVRTVIPAVDPADIEVSLVGDRLTIAADVLDDYGSEDTLVHLEDLIHGRYEQSVRIPTEVDASEAEANYDNGLLTITFPKSNPGLLERLAIDVKRAFTGDKS